MTIGEIFLAIIILLFAVGAILVVFYIWFSIWKKVSETGGNIVAGEDDSSAIKKIPDIDLDEEK